jgi:hypothetical protein
MKAIRNSQMCSGFHERAKKAMTTEEAWAAEVVDHETGSDYRRDFLCGCRLLDTDKGDSLSAPWGSGVFTINGGVLECVSYGYDSSD